MKLLELFDSRDKKKRMSHIKNLLALAFADGHFDDNERDLITRIGINSGLKLDEVDRIFNRPESVKFYPPESFKERAEQIYEMVLLMMIDGEIDANEIVFCKFMAEKLGFRHQIIDVLVKDIINAIAEGIAFEILMHDLTSYE